MRELDWSDATGLSDLFRNVFSQCWGDIAFTEADGINVRYEELAYEIDQLHQLFRRARLQTGDRVALLGYNSAHWAAVYIATITYGAIVVPMPEDLKNWELYRILEHAEAKFLFVGEQIWEELNEFYLTNLEAIICLQNWQIFNTRNPLLHEWEHSLVVTKKREKAWLLARMAQYFSAQRLPLCFPIHREPREHPKVFYLPCGALYTTCIVLVRRYSSLLAIH